MVDLRIGHGTLVVQTRRSVASLTAKAELRRLTISGFLHGADVIGRAATESLDMVKSVITRCDHKKLLESMHALGIVSLTRGKLAGTRAGHLIHVFFTSRGKDEARDH